MSEDPYAALKAEDKNDGNLKKVMRELADMYLEAEELVAQKTKELEDAQKALDDIAVFRIPTALDGLDGNFPVGDGITIQVKEHIRASIAGEKAKPAIKWLDDNGYGNIVKRQLIAEFPKEDQERFQEFLTKITPALQELHVVLTDKHSVHPGTLVAWVKEKLGEGVELPVETFGIFRQRKGIVKKED